MSLFEELKRRNVFRVGIAYVLLGWAVLQGADFLLDLVGAPEWVIRALAVIGLVGLPFALFFSWAFELTPEGIKREEEVDRSQSVTTQTGRKLNGLIIGLLLLVILLMAVERFFFVGSSVEGGHDDTARVPKSIAVLPFADLSEAHDQEWFADGLAEEILNALSKAPDIQVTARTSSFAFKGSNKEIPEIAAELGVAHILEGSVRRSGDRIRVTAQLIRASDGFHLWSQNYDRNVADMIGIQEDLARNIATALETSMDPQALEQMARVGTRSVEAYQEYLRGVRAAAESDTFSVGQRQQLWRQAYEYFERARTIDPTFSEAHIRAAYFWKSELTPNRMETGLSGLPPQEVLREFNERIGRAIDTAGNEADRIHGLALRAMVDLQLRESRQLFERYVELRPNDWGVRTDFVSVLLMLGEKEEAKKVIGYWKEKQSSDLNSAIQYVEQSWRAGDAVDGAEIALKAVQRWPTAEQLLYQGHRTLLWAGRVNEGRKLVSRFEVLVPGGFVTMTARQACAEGDRKTAEQLFNELDPTVNLHDFQKWFFLNLLGRVDEETAFVRQMLRRRTEYAVASFLTYPQFDPRPYPELMALLEREGVQRPPPVEPPFKCPPPSQPSIAVLPFVNMSADPENEYFSEGVAEEILNVLARVPELKVTARTSSFSYKGSNATVAQIARDLGVNHVLEGSVRKAGNEVRVTAQLIEAGSDFHLWSETYDRKLDNIFAIQDEIAQSIAEALKVRLLPAAEQPNQTGTTNLEAYELYLKGVKDWHLRTGESLERALDLFEQAVKLDPSFARAHAYRALTWAVMPDYTDVPLREMRRETLSAAEIALKLDPSSVEAATALINALLPTSLSELNQLIEQGRELIARNPGFATTHQWQAINLLNADRVDESIAEYRKALELDPRSLVIHQNLAVLLVTLGRFEEADALLSQLDSFAPDYWDGALTRFILYLLSGQREMASQAGMRLERILGRNQDTLPIYLDLFFEPQRRSAAAAQIASFPRQDWWNPDNPSLIDDYALPLLFAAAGEPGEALDAMRTTVGHDFDIYSAALVRVSKLTGDFSCRPEVKAYYTELGLPPAPEPPDC